MFFNFGQKSVNIVVNPWHCGKSWLEKIKNKYLYRNKDDYEIFSEQKILIF